MRLGIELGSMDAVADTWVLLCIDSDCLVCWQRGAYHTLSRHDAPNNAHASRTLPFQKTWKTKHTLISLFGTHHSKQINYSVSSSSFGLLLEHNFERSSSVSDEFGVDTLEWLVSLPLVLSDTESMRLLILVVSRVILTLSHLYSITSLQFI